MPRNPKSGLQKRSAGEDQGRLVPWYSNSTTQSSFNWLFHRYLFCFVLNAISKPRQHQGHRIGSTKATAISHEDIYGTIIDTCLQKIWNLFRQSYYFVWSSGVLCWSEWKVLPDHRQHVRPSSDTAWEQSSICFQCCRKHLSICAGYRLRSQQHPAQWCVNWPRSKQQTCSCQWYWASTKPLKAWKGKFRVSIFSSERKYFSNQANTNFKIRSWRCCD